MDTDPEMPTTADGADEHVPFRTRKRRVSFAETTTIHIFDRDQTESSTPDPNSDRSDDEVEDDCEENGLFLKHIVDFSPGSTLGSATSNEDSNNFGPVSSSFLKSAQLTGVSDNNDNDVTHDSASFSVHFGRLLPKDEMSAGSVGILSTPTTNFIPASAGNLMSITNPIAKNAREISEQGKSSGSEMSIVAFGLEGYNCRNLSPMLDALSAKSNESLHTLSPKINNKLESPNSYKAHGSRDLRKSVNKEPGNKKARKVSLKFQDSNIDSLSSPQRPCLPTSPEALKIESLPSRKHPNDIFSKVSEIANKPFPFPIDRLSMAEIDMFEEKLSDLQRARKFERIFIDIQSVKKPHPLGSEHQKRLAEVKLLQDVFVFEKLKKLLLNAKRRKIIEKKQRLQSGTEECNKLRCILLKNNHSSSVEGNNKNTHHQLVKKYPRVVCLEEQNKVVSLRQEIKNKEGKLKQLKADFKEIVPENASFIEIVKFVHNHIKRRNHHRLIQKKLMIFPNMGACIAFNFIFAPKYDCSFHDSKCAWQETQRNIIIFSNLLYLLKEVQVIWLQLGNLISSIFCSSHSEQLKLDFTFLNQKNGEKVIVSLDMTNLKSGIYPSKPSEWHIQVLDCNKKVLVCNYKDEIMNSILDIKHKYSAITKLCQCVSHIVQSSE